jgi:hypothetical protein
MDKVKIYIDENLPPQLAKGLHELQQPLNISENIHIEVQSFKEVYGKGAKDEDWLPSIGGENGIVITQDYRIQTQRHQKEIYISSGVGILFLNPPSKTGFSYWEMVKLLINRWDEIKGILRKHKPPFAFRCTARTKFEKLDL